MVALGGPAGRRLVEWQDPDPLDIYHVHFETFGVDLVLPRFMGQFSRHFKAKMFN